MALSGRVSALVILATALVRTLLRRAFGRGPRGLALFARNYDADRLPALSPEERADLPSLGGCIACGRCDRGDAARIAASEGAYPGTMALVLASSRSMPDFDAAAVAFALVSDEALAEKERLCPTGVPLRRLAAFVRAKAAPRG